MGRQQRGTFPGGSSSCRGGQKGRRLGGKRRGWVEGNGRGTESRGGKGGHGRGGQGLVTKTLLPGHYHRNTSNGTSPTRYSPRTLLPGADGFSNHHATTARTPSPGHNHRNSTKKALPSGHHQLDNITKIPYAAYLHQYTTTRTLPPRHHHWDTTTMTSQPGRTEIRPGATQQGCDSHCRGDKEF